VSTAKSASQEAVVRALASRNELTNAEISATAGLARSTVGKALVALEGMGIVRRHPGGRHGRLRLPDRWSAGHGDEHHAPARGAAQRLRPGQLDGLVLGYINSQGTAVGATAVAKALGRSAGAVGNCLTRLAGVGQVRQVSEKPRHYTSATSRSSKPARGRPRKEGS
jgi:DNA-binding IclR family transcriptional regulator